MPTLTADELWLSHPITEHVIDDAGLDPERVLFHYIAVLNDIEDRFPGVPFRDLFGMVDGTVSVNKVRSGMRQAGLSSQQIDEALSGTPGARGQDRVAVADWDYEADLFPLLAAGAASDDLVVHLAVGRNRAEELLTIRSPMNERQQRCIDLLDAGMNLSEAGREVGVSRNTVRKAELKRWYQRWLEAQGL